MNCWNGGCEASRRTTDGVELQGAGQPAVLDRDVDDGAQQSVSRPYGIGLRLGGLQRLLQSGESALGRGDDDVVLGLELPVHRRLGHPDRIGDHLQ